MKIFVCSDLHSFFTPFKAALDEKGFEPNNPEHLLVVCGDVFDRGTESVAMFEFLDKLKNVVMVRGNHEDLLVDLLSRGYSERHDISNGTTTTVADLVRLTGTNPSSTREVCSEVKKLIMPFLDKMVNYFETKNYVFVHGWIPCDAADKFASTPWYQNGRKFKYNPDWRDCSDLEWDAARWINGIDAGFVKKEKALEPDKTIVCGHWHSSYGHYWQAVKKAVAEGKSIFEADSEEFGPKACFEPFKADGIMAVDTCTVYTGKVNVVVLEDDLLEENTFYSTDANQ